MHIFRTVIVALVLLPAAAQAQQIQPGEWSYSNKITSMSGPKIPPAMAQAILKEPATVDTKCVSPAEAATGFQKMLQQKDQDCTLAKGSVAGGMLDVTRICKEPDGKTMTTHLHGPMTPSGFTLTAEASGPDMKMTMDFAAKRVGPCK